MLHTNPCSVRILAQLSMVAPAREEEWGSPSRQQDAVTSPVTGMIGDTNLKF